MKILISVFILMNLFLFSSNTVQANPNKLQVGFNLSQYQNDFGVGVNIVTPHIVNESLAFKFGYNNQWFEHAAADGLDIETVWTAYQNIQLGIRSRNPIIKDKVYIYGEGGLVIIMPNEKFSSESSELGGYGLFGFEFFVFDRFSYYLEVGGVGTGAIANEIAFSPIYSNGILLNVGFRVGLF